MLLLFNKIIFMHIYKCYNFTRQYHNTSIFPWFLGILYNGKNNPFKHADVYTYNLSHKFQPIYYSKYINGFQKMFDLYKNLYFYTPPSHLSFVQYITLQA